MKRPRVLSTIMVALNLIPAAPVEAVKKIEEVFVPESIVNTQEEKVYVGNTIRITIPEVDGMTVKCVIYESKDINVATVEQGIVMGRSQGDVIICSKVTYESESNQNLSYIQYETKVRVLVGTLRLKTIYATKYQINGEQILKERESTLLSKGKTAKIVPALSYGVFSGIRYESSDETIATVSQDGLTGLVKGLQPGKVTITAFADIGGTELTKTITVNVKKQKLPIANPENAENYTGQDKWKGSLVYFGNYEQDDNFANGREPILWRVLQVQKDSVLLLAEHGLDSRNMNDTFTDVTWEKCTMRRWLNDTFYKRAFSGEEAEVILTTTLKTPGNSLYDTVENITTKDKVFLLSIEEATNPAYGFYPKFDKISKTREVQNTAYAAAHDGYVNKKNGNTCWWLRSNGMSNQFSYIFTNGSGTHSYFVGRRNDAVRPAIRIKLSAVSFAIDSKRGDYPYIVVD